jgi:hypothetical protein
MKTMYRTVEHNAKQKLQFTEIGKKKNPAKQFSRKLQ